MTICVYAIVPPGVKVRGVGLTGERLRVVAAGAVAAIAGEVRRLPAASRANLVAYDRILLRLAAVAASIVPARFGTGVADYDELAFILRTRQRSLRRALGRVRNRAQMTVRLMLVTPGTGRRSAAPSRNAAAGQATSRQSPTSGVGFLRARAAAMTEERELPAFGPLRASVQRWVREERVEKRGGIATVYHLRPRRAAAAYQRAMGRAAAASGVRAVVTGPWLPYAFAEPEGASRG
jgi:hypothetical protein